MEQSNTSQSTPTQATPHNIKLDWARKNGRKIASIKTSDINSIIQHTLNIGIYIGAAKAKEVFNSIKISEKDNLSEKTEENLGVSPVDEVDKSSENQ